MTELKGPEQATLIAGFTVFCLISGISQFHLNVGSINVGFFFVVDVLNGIVQGITGILLFRSFLVVWYLYYQSTKNKKVGWEDIRKEIIFLLTLFLFTAGFYVLLDFFS